MTGSLLAPLLTAAVLVAVVVPNWKARIWVCLIFALGALSGVLAVLN